MKLKQMRFVTLFIFLFIFAANISLEARHSRRSTTYITNTYVAPAPRPTYVVQEYYAPGYAPVQTVVYHQPVVYQQPVYQERVVIRDRQSPGSLFTSFALGLGFGLLAH